MPKIISPHSQKIRDLIDEHWPGRGRFKRLQEASGISEQRWKNFYYGNQNAAQDMIEFAQDHYPDAMPSPSKLFSEYPFAVSPPTREQSTTIGDRLAWVIAEWAAPEGEDLFNYLSEKSSGLISPHEWSQVLLKVKQPSAEMMRIVTSARRLFTEWVIHGSVSSSSYDQQVDPTDAKSVEAYRQRDKTELMRALDDIQQQTNHEELRQIAKLNVELAESVAARKKRVP